MTSTVRAFASILIDEINSNRSVSPEESEGYQARYFQTHAKARNALPFNVAKSSMLLYFGGLQRVHGNHLERVLIARVFTLRIESPNSQLCNFVMLRASPVGSGHFDRVIRQPDGLAT